MRVRPLQGWEGKECRGDNMLPHEGWFVCNQFFIISYEHCSWLFGWSLYHCLLPRTILLYLVWGRGRFRSDGGHGSCRYSSPQIFSNFEPSESGFEPSESGLNLLRVVLSLLRVVLSLLRVVLSLLRVVLRH